MVGTIKVSLASVAENEESYPLPDMDGCIAVIAEALFIPKRSKSNFNKLMEFSIGTVLIDCALFVFHLCSFSIIAICTYVSFYSFFVFNQNNFINFSFLVLTDFLIFQIWLAYNLFFVANQYATVQISILRVYKRNLLPAWE